MELEELKEWLKIDGEDEDKTLSSLLISSRAIIKNSTGVKLDDIKKNEEAFELYKLIQKVICINLYENKEETFDKSVVSLSIQLGAYKNAQNK